MSDSTAEACVVEAITTTLQQGYHILDRTVLSDLAYALYLIMREDDNADTREGSQTAVNTAGV